MELCHAVRRPTSPFTGAVFLCVWKYGLVFVSGMIFAPSTPFRKRELTWRSCSGTAARTTKSFARCSCLDRCRAWWASPLGSSGVPRSPQKIRVGGGDDGLSFLTKHEVGAWSLISQSIHHSDRFFYFDATPSQRALLGKDKPEKMSNRLSFIGASLESWRRSQDAVTPWLAEGCEASILRHGWSAR